MFSNPSWDQRFWLHYPFIMTCDTRWGGDDDNLEADARVALIIILGP